MRRTLYIECGAAETRAAIFRGDEIIGFEFAPARGDEHLPRAADVGDVFLGRVRTVSKSLNAAFVDIGEAEDGFLQVKKGEGLPVEGASLVVRARRPALGSKGAVLSAQWKDAVRREEEDAIESRTALRAAPAKLNEARDAALCVIQARDFADFDEIVMNDAGAAWLIRAFAAGFGANPKAIEVVDFSFRDLGVDDAIESALDREARLAGGARLVFDETEAMSVVDVDSGAAGAGKASAVNDRVNIAAAKALFPELARRAAGGRIIVDFLPPSDAKARAALLETLAKSAEGVFKGRFGKLSVDGVFDLTAPRERRSLLERASEPAAGADWLRLGRRLTLDWRAKATIRALEQRLRTETSARLTLLAGAALASYIAGRPQWRERLAQRFGARFDIMADPKLEERAFDVAERR